MTLTLEEIDHFELLIGDRLTIENTHAICTAARAWVEQGEPPSLDDMIPEAIRYVDTITKLKADVDRLRGYITTEKAMHTNVEEVLLAEVERLSDANATFSGVQISLEACQDALKETQDELVQRGAAVAQMVHFIRRCGLEPDYRDMIATEEWNPKEILEKHFPSERKP